MTFAYSAHRLTSDAATQDTDKLRTVFESITAESCPHAYNFHMHTCCSDGNLPPEELMEQAIAIGLKGLAITDHHTVRGFQQVQQWLEDWQWKHPSANKRHSLPQLWTGVEISSGLLGEEVHLLCYGFDPNHSAMQPYLQGQAPRGTNYQAGQVINAAHQAGALVVLAHPARYRRSHDEMIAAVVDLNIDGVETYYAYNNPDPWKPSPKQTQAVRKLADRYGILQTCGTDTHGPSLLKRV